MIEILNLWSPHKLLNNHGVLSEYAKCLQSLKKIKSLLSIRVSFETSFDSKQPKLEPKLVSALSETKRLFRLFRFYSETASFGDSVKPKLTETNRNQPKQAENSAFCFSILSLKLSVLHHLVLSLDVSVLLPLDLLVPALSSLCCFFVSL